MVNGLEERNERRCDGRIRIRIHYTTCQQRVHEADRLAQCHLAVQVTVWALDWSVTHLQYNTELACSSECLRSVLAIPSRRRVEIRQKARYTVGLQSHKSYEHDVLLCKSGAVDKKKGISPSSLGLRLTKFIGSGLK